MKGKIDWYKFTLISILILTLVFSFVDVVMMTGAYLVYGITNLDFWTQFRLEGIQIVLCAGFLLLYDKKK